MNVAGPAWRRADRARSCGCSPPSPTRSGIAVERARLAEEGTRLARAEERTRIAREIHDTLAQGLTAIGLDIEGALRHLAERAPSGRASGWSAPSTTTRDSLEEARRSVLDLRAAPLAGRPLAEALAALGRAFTSETGVPASVSGPRATAALPLRVEAELYRIAQEALANVRQHAQATQVEIALRARPREVVLVDPRRRRRVRRRGRGADGRPRPGRACANGRDCWAGGCASPVGRAGGRRVTARVPLGREGEA